MADRSEKPADVKPKAQLVKRKLSKKQQVLFASMLRILNRHKSHILQLEGERHKLQKQYLELQKEIAKRNDEVKRVHDLIAETRSTFHMCAIEHLTLDEQKRFRAMLDGAKDFHVNVTDDELILILE